jgi:tetratricopeptide (TPR) repeat protein
MASIALRCPAFSGRGKVPDLLKKALGDDAIEATRSHCRITTQFQITSDFENANLRQNAAFMPGQSGEWFEDIRSENWENGSAESSTNLPISDFAKTLEWLAAHSPANMYSVMREALQLTQGLSTKEVTKFLNTAGEDSKNDNWRNYYYSYFGENSSELENSNRLSRKVLKEAVKSKDYILAVESAYYLSATYLVQGRYVEATKAVAACQFCAEKVNRPDLLAKAASIRGILLINIGNVSEGLMELERSELSLGNEFAVAHAQALRGFMETSKGLHSRALETIKAPFALASASGHRRLSLMCSVTSSHAFAGLGRKKESLDVILPALKNLVETQMSFFSTYAYEAAAIAYLLNGEHELARNNMRLAQQNRGARGMPYTLFDRGRIGEANMQSLSSD